MKNLKFSVPGQMLLMAKSHLTTAFVFMIFFLFTIGMSSSAAYKTIFGICGTLGYFLTIYASASSAYFDDKKTVSPLTPKPAKGFILPLGITAISIIMILIYKLAWSYGVVSTGGLSLWAGTLNIAFLLWVAPYQHFLGLDNGTISAVGYIIIFLIPFIASGLGYFATYKGFDLNAKMHGIAYEKKKDKSEF